jgi:hypothetical protein
MAVVFFHKREYININTKKIPVTHSLCNNIMSRKIPRIHKDERTKEKDEEKIKSSPNQLETCNKEL